MLRLLDGSLELAEPLARRLLGLPITLPLVFGFQAGPFVGIDRLEVGPVVLAIGCGLRREQRRIDAVDRRLRMPVLLVPIWLLPMWLLGSADVRCDANDRGLGLRMGRRIGFALHCVARTGGEQQRA